MEIFSMNKSFSIILISLTLAFNAYSEPNLKKNEELERIYEQSVVILDFFKKQEDPETAKSHPADFDVIGGFREALENTKSRKHLTGMRILFKDLKEMVSMLTEDEKAALQELANQNEVELSVK
jgi:hypothetical protein